MMPLCSFPLRFLPQFSSQSKTIGRYCIRALTQPVSSSLNLGACGSGVVGSDSNELTLNAVNELNTRLRNLEALMLCVSLGVCVKLVLANPHKTKPANNIRTTTLRFILIEVLLISGKFGLVKSLIGFGIAIHEDSDPYLLIIGTTNCLWRWEPTIVVDFYNTARR